MKIVLTGIQPSGALHLGNYLGAMQPAVQLQEQGQAVFFIADYHALTSLSDPKKLREYSLQLGAAYMAAGVDCQRTILFKQSAIPEVHELAWLLSVVTPMGLLERGTSFKDKVANGVESNHGLFAYPVLMAADILLYGADLVPVGKDQKQHLEMARDMAQKFNDKFGKVLKLPEPLIREEVATVPGLDGAKMSKSKGNTLELFAEPKQLEKRIMSIATDSTPMDQPKPVARSVLGQLMEAVATPEEYQAFLNMAATPGTGYGSLKKEFARTFLERFAPIQAKYRQLMENQAHLEQLLADGAIRAALWLNRFSKELVKPPGSKMPSEELYTGGEKPSAFQGNRLILPTDGGAQELAEYKNADVSKANSALSYVRLPVFEGPLDLLLYLIRKEEVDIYDIPIERITHRYLEYLRLIKMIDLEVVGDYLVVAATLIYIKSRILLPETDRPPEEEVDEEDPRWELIRQLVEYKKFKDAATELQQAYLDQEKKFGRGVPVKPDWNAEGTVPFAQVSLFDLLTVFQKILDKANAREDLRDIFEDRFTVSDKIQMIRDQLKERDRLNFEELFSENSTRTEVVVTFLAVLELIRLRVLAVTQKEAFDPIELARMDPPVPVHADGTVPEGEFQ